MDSQPTIRFATENDLPRISEIDRLSFKDTWSINNFKEALKDLFLVFEDKEILGFLIACCCDLAKKAIILKIAVHPDHRGKGITSRLIETVLEDIKKMKIGDVEIDVDVVKTRVKELYEKFGFRIMQVVSVNNDNESFYMMKLKLNQN